ncbi:Zn-dependent exopeptidase [Cryphonectria parasitica EP155]|uniref:Inactive metallocarboxypeptidase ECM14 n=1 Tax=Cryphonectria parasitica (strain ATCC 38755 / EP155) TaxID=660469 RepID=A0A9P4XT57_CRYP1|nr:Zn-dependent exopeptidase [Cryphonectria parasitica EP155]KAF3760230.1 Zn-dependent exopeptidase [Cryphonectria parasitica EP155]
MHLPSSTLFPLRHGHHNHPHPSRSGSSVFPYLTWLRDSAVKIVFGGHSAKDTSGPRPANLHRMFKDEIIVRFNTSTVEEERALAEATERLFLDIWSWDDMVDLRIQKNKVASLLTLLPESLAPAYWVLVEDLPSAVYDSYPSPPAPQDPSKAERKFSLDLTSSLPSDGDENIYFFQNYQPHKVVMRWMRLVEAMFPSFVRYTTIGQSYEGRDIPALVVSGSNAASRDRTKPRKTLVVMGGSHAREWISTTTVNYLAWSFITSYGKDMLITKFLQSHDVVFIPELNPDGIEYTWTADRLWRKSRQHTSMMFCRGLDLDHAFGYEWDSSSRAGHTNDPCSESYGGDEPWESVEVAALRDWARTEAENNNADFVGLVDLHSYSQQILFPYAYSCAEDPPNLEKLQELAMGLAKSIRLFSGETYAVKPACQGAVPDSLSSSADGLRIEPSGGSAIDWFYHEMGAHYSYQIKLRDTGSYGFLLPSEHIIPTGEEILQALKYLGDFLLGNDGIENLRADEGVESNDELFAVPEEYEEVMELKKRRKR